MPPGTGDLSIPAATTHVNDDDHIRGEMCSERAGVVVWGGGVEPAAATGEAATTRHRVHGGSDAQALVDYALVPQKFSRNWGLTRIGGKQLREAGFSTTRGVARAVGVGTLMGGVGRVPVAVQDSCARVNH